MPLTHPSAARRDPAMLVRLAAAAALCSLAMVAGAALAPSAHAANVGEFESLAPSPVDLTSIAVNPGTNIIYAQENEGNRFFSYDPRTNEWTELGESPINSGNNGGATYLNGKIYTSYTENAEVGVYDIASNTWTVIASPLGEGTANITAAGEDIYMSIGNKLVKYDPATETTTELAGSPFSFEAWGGLQPHEGKIYGDSGDGGSRFGAYNVESNEWTELPEVPGGAVAGSALDPVSGTYFADGSYGGTGFYRYEIGSNSWTTATLPFEVGDSGMAYVSLPAHTGVYVSQGESGTEFARYVTPEAEADLSLTKTASVSSIPVGGEFTYTMRVANAGPFAAPNATVTDALPLGVTFVSDHASQGQCSGATTVTCHLGTVAKEGTAVVAITVKASAPGSATNTATVEGEARDPNPANNSARATVIVTPAAATISAITVQPRAGIAIARVHRLVKGRLARVTLTCKSTGAACVGRLSLAWVHKVHGRLKTTLISRRSYTLAAGKSKQFTLNITADGLKVLQRAHGRGLVVRTRATTREGEVVRHFVPLKHS